MADEMHTEFSPILGAVPQGRMHLSEARHLPLSGIIDAIGEVLWLRSPDTQELLYCSRALEAILGERRERLYEHPTLWRERVHPDDAERVAEAIRRCGAGRPYEMTYRVMRPDGSVRLLLDRGFPWQADEGHPARVAALAQDVTEQKQLQAELRKAYDALHSSVNGVIITDLAGQITYANPAFTSMFGFGSAEEVLGRKVEQLVAAARIEPSPVAHSGPVAYHHTAEFMFDRSDGQRLVVEMSTSPVHDSDGQRAGGMASFVDVTERKRRESESRLHQLRLRNLTARMAQVEEQERRRISAVIHDTAVQSLSLANIKMGGIRQSLALRGLDEEQAELEKIRELLAEGIQQCRLIISDLTPPLLYEAGLAAALVELSRKLNRLHGTTIAVRDSNPPAAVPEAFRGLLFQATRELILNACKHAGESGVDVELARDSGLLRICVRDLGQGFDPAVVEGVALNETGGFGLFSIRERLENIRGSLRIQSAPGQGTTATILVPV